MSCAKAVVAVDAKIELATAAEITKDFMIMVITLSHFSTDNSVTCHFSGSIAPGPSTTKPRMRGALPEFDGKTSTVPI